MGAIPVICGGRRHPLPKPWVRSRPATAVMRAHQGLVGCGAGRETSGTAHMRWVVVCVDGAWPENAGAVVVFVVEAPDTHRPRFHLARSR
jgi:hypothetical protein